MADRIKGITVEINGDATGLSNALKGINSEISRTDKQLKDVNKLLKLDPGNTELLRQRQVLLADAIGETRSKLEKLKEAEKEAQKQFEEGKISESQYNALKREIIDTEQKLKSLESQAGKTSKALSDGLKEAGTSIQEAGKKITEAGKNLTTTFTVPVAGIAKASAKAWEEVDEGLDSIIIKTGASGDALAEMQGIMKDLAVTIPTDFKTAGDAVGEVNTRFGSMGEELSDLSDYFIRFSELNKTDVSKSVDSVQTSMAAFNLEAGDAKNVLDTLNKAGQDTGKNVIELSDEIAKNSQKMKDLGFTYSDSAFFLANLSKNGIDASTVLSGLSKAQANAAKDGKTLRESLKDLQKKLKETDTRAEATKEIMELFGAKAGTQLADALSTGKLSFDSFGESLDAFAGNVQKTFEAVQDPPDRLKVAMNALKVSGAELADSVLQTVAPVMESLIGKIKALTEWFNGLDDEHKKAIVTIGLVAAAMGPLIIVIGSVVSSIGTIVGAIGTFLEVGGSMVAFLTGATAEAGAFGGAMALLAGPGGGILLAVAALGMLAAAFAEAKNDASDYHGELRELSEAEEANRQKTEELYEAYQETKEARETSIGQANREAEQERNLWNELQKITDENGKIKEGYEDRAQVIIDQLQSALGIEIDLTDGVIQKYDELGQSIDDVIEKKRAEAILTAYQGEYAEALRNSATAQANYATAAQNAARTANELAQKESELEATLNRQGAIQGEVNAHNVTAQQENNRLIQTINELRPQVEDLNAKYESQQQTLAMAEEAYVGYQTTIANTEAIQAAISGNGDLQDALLKAQVGFQTAETGTRESLQRQADDFRTQYEAMRKSAQDGTSGISQDVIEGYRKLAVDAEAELRKVGGELGKDITEGQKQGIAEGTDEIGGALEEQANSGIDRAKTAWGAHSPSTVSMEIGRDWDAGLALGIGVNAQEVYTAVETVANGATAKLTETLTASQGQVTAYQASSSASWATWSAAVLAALNSAYAQMTAANTAGMQNIHSTIESILTQIRSKWEEQWKAIEQKHQQEMQTIRDKNREGMQDIRTTVETEMTATAELHKQKMEEMKTATEEGMNAILESVKAKAAELKPALEAGVEPAVQYLKDLIPMGRKWGDDFMSNYIAAVRERLAELEEVCEEAADIVSDYLECSRPDKGPMHDYPVWGKDFMEGYADSLRSNEWRVLNQMDSLAGKMQQAMTGEENSGRPFVLNTTSQTILDGKVLAETVNTELGVIL